MQEIFPITFLNRAENTRALFLKGKN